MAESDFLIFGASAADVARGVTAGFTPPGGGGSFVFGFDSKVSGSKVVALRVAGANFNPLKDDAAAATGGSIRGVVKRGIAPSPIGFSIGLFINLQVATENDFAYVLGLSDNDPHEIVLAKTSMISPLDPASTAILRTSANTFAPDTWHQLRLDSIVNPNGDVVLKMFKNSDLTGGEPTDVTNPTWDAISGMADFVDDVLGINAASTGNPQPLAGGFGGFYFQSAATNARGFVDQLELHRQR